MIQIQLIEDFCDTEVYYAFRDKRNHLYIGYDGYDTDFVKGVSSCVHHSELITELNKKLITKTRSELIELLTVATIDKEWKQLGGIDNIEIVRLELIIEGRGFSPSGLLNLLSADNEEDYQE